MFKHTILVAAVAGMVLAMAPAAEAGVIGELGVLQDTANGGINPATLNPWAPGDTYRLFFVSGNTLRDATSPDIADYHTAVQGAAGAAGLGGASWYCVGQSYNDPSRATNAYDKGSTDVAIFMVNNAMLADAGTGDLIDIPPNVTETGGTYSGHVATGGGRVFGDPGQTNIEYGESGFSSGGWWRNYNGAQTSQWHFYALSEDLTTIPEPATLALLGLGGLGLILGRKRK